MPTTTFDSNQKIRQISFYLLLIFLGVFLFLQMQKFLPSFLGAITFYILSRSSMVFLVEKKKWRKSRAATLILIVSFLVVVVPIGFSINIISSKLGYAVGHSNQILSAITVFVKSIELKFNVHILTDENLNNLKGTSTRFITGIVKTTFNSITTVMVMYFILYFMLISRKDMERWLFKYIPLHNENIVTIGQEMKSLVISNALGIPLVAIVQAIVGLIAYLFLGVNDVWFWFVFTCIASMLPLVGSALAYVPLSIVLYVNHHNWQAIVLLIYGVAVIGTVDNVFRFMLQKKMGNVHPLITVFGVIIGINLFGFIGLIFGPILISMFILLVKIYMNEFIIKATSTENQLENS